MPGGQRDVLGVRIAPALLRFGAALPGRRYRAELSIHNLRAGSCRLRLLPPRRPQVRGGRGAERPRGAARQPSERCWEARGEPRGDPPGDPCAPQVPPFARRGPRQTRVTVLKVGGELGEREGRGDGSRRRSCPSCPCDDPEEAAGALGHPLLLVRKPGRGSGNTWKVFSCRASREALTFFPNFRYTVTEAFWDELGAVESASFGRAALILGFVSFHQPYQSFTCFRSGKVQSILEEKRLLLVIYEDGDCEQKKNPNLS